MAHILLVVGLFPAPVRTAPTLTTGTDDLREMHLLPMRTKSAPQASTLDPMSITSALGTSEYANTTWSTSFSLISLSSSSSA